MFGREQTRRGKDGAAICAIQKMLGGRWEPGSARAGQRQEKECLVLSCTAEQSCVCGMALWSPARDAPGL